MSADHLTRLIAESHRLARETAHRHQVEVSIREASIDAPAAMSDTMIGRILRACDQLALGHERMPSGAGHDAQVMALTCETGMIFVPNQGGASHRADEWTDPDALKRGANVLLHTLLEMVAGR